MARHCTCIAIESSLQLSLWSGKCLVWLLVLHESRRYTVPGCVCYAGTACNVIHLENLFSMQNHVVAKFAAC